jgi:hypothetical protein
MKISTTYSYTKNLGNYQSTKVEMGIERDITCTEDIDVAINLKVDLDFLKREVADGLKDVK